MKQVLFQAGHCHRNLTDMTMKAKLPLLFHREIPTVDIYFLQPLKSLITTWTPPSREHPIQRLGPYCFFAGDQAVIIRYASKWELRAIRSRQPKRCLYLIDDDLWSMDTDSSLPKAYHRYLAPFKRRILPEITDMADCIVTPNKAIHRHFPDKERLLLDPSYTSLCADFSHFDNPRQLNMIFTGSHTHLSDLQFISKVLARLVERYQQVTLTTFLGRNAPDILKRHKRIIHLFEKPWPAYKKILRTQRFHIALAPYRDTVFNQARSVNKVFDHAAFGAAGVYSNLPPLSLTIEPEVNGLLVEEDGAAWSKAVENLIKRPQEARRLARGGADLARKIGDPARVARFWRRQLNV